MMDADTSVMQERIGELCHQFKMPTMGAQSVARFTEAGHGDALSTFLEVLEQEAEDRRHRHIKHPNSLRARPGKPSSTTGCLWHLDSSWTNWPRTASWSTASTCWPSGCPAPARPRALRPGTPPGGNRPLRPLRSGLPPGAEPAPAKAGDLLAAKRDFDLPRQLHKLDSFDFLLLDDLGYLPQIPPRA